jgi:predicted phosphodiesterase
MGKEISPSREAALKYLARFPKAATLTVAKALYRDHSPLFPNLEAARTLLRTLRGSAGDRLRKLCSQKENYRAPGKPGDPFGKIPRARNPFDEKWVPLQIEGPTRALVMSDIHLPFHDRAALMAALRAGKRAKVKLILLNGDMIDCHAISKWEKDPRKRDFPGELKMTRSFLETLRAAFPKARIILKLGNHEERFESYMFCKAPELLGVPDFELANLLRLSDIGAEHVREKRLIRLGELNVLHGHEYRYSISNPVNPARGLFLRAKAHALCGHFHQSSYHQAKNIEGKHVGCWSIGALCQLQQDYAPFNEWIHGFAIVDVDVDGKFEVSHHIITAGKVR